MPSPGRALADGAEHDAEETAFEILALADHEVVDVGHPVKRRVHV